ncbi:MAG: hypothetical protein J0M12_13825 [Deltaproteobacteria bacterium]|nr:hypothetical protein [Deltaproteobacteria bacterium]
MNERADDEILPQTAALFLITVISLFLRLYIPWSAGFPLNDGGLFYRMILDLEGNAFSLPHTTSYNQAGLPFSYPPLGIYLGALLHHFSGVDLLLILQILPPLIAALCLLPAWGIISIVLESSTSRIFAYAVYALSYSSFEWLIMGGGITRAPGMFFALCAIYFFLRSQRGGTTSAVLSGISAGLTCLSHPHACVFMLISLGALFLFRQPRPQVKVCITIAIPALLLSSLWIVSLAQRGLMTGIWEAARTGKLDSDSIYRIIDPLLFGIGELPFFVNVLLFLGVAHALAQKRWIFVAWFACVYLIPRLSSNYMMLPVSLLTGIGAASLVGALLSNSHADSKVNCCGIPIRKLIWACFIGALTATSFSKTAHLLTTTLSPTTVKEFELLATQTPPQSAFLVITSGQVHHHHITEWFPAFSQRHSILTPEGKEWKNAAEFKQINKTHNELYELIENPQQQMSVDLQQAFDQANYLVVDAESSSLPLGKEWQSLKQFEGLTIYARNLQGM